MKYIICLLLAFVTLSFNSYAEEHVVLNDIEEHVELNYKNIGYCSGYASTMYSLYKTKRYQNMMKYFNAQYDMNASDSTQSELMSEYLIEGSKVVKPHLSAKDNEVRKCTVLYAEYTKE